MKNKVKLTESIQSKSVEPACAEFPSNVVRKSAKRFTDIVKSIENQYLHIEYKTTQLFV